MIDQRDDATDRLEAALDEITRDRDRLRALNASLTDQLHEILQSRAWRWLMRCRRILRRVRRWLPSAAPTRPPTPVPGTSTVGRIDSPLDALTLLPEPVRDEAATLLAPAGLDGDRPRVDVVCFGVIDWEFRYQRPQQLMAQFAAHGHRVFYISPSRFVTDSPGAAPVVRTITHNLFEVQLATSRQPDVYGEVLDSADGLAESIAILRRDCDISAALSYVMLSSWSDVAFETSRRWGWTVVYDCMDEWENFPGIKRAVVAAESRLVARCDLLVVSAERLQKKWAARGRQSLLVRNAADYAFYETRCRPNRLLADVGHPVVGYFGAIASWFDVDLVVEVARARPQYTFVLLGGVFSVDVAALRALPNVRLLGQQPYVAMPQYLYHFDVCLIPFKLNPTTEATDPVKLYEYLSAGKPVVSVALPELEWCREHLYLAHDAQEFLAQVDLAVAEDDPQRAGQRRLFAASHTWADRYRRIHDGLAEVCPRASIIVVTHNNVGLTELCLESLLRHTNHPQYEVIVVDNASTDGTPAYLRHMATRHAELTVIFNRENRGFSAANNQGLARSTGSHLVLLNNDTVVPSGWLPRLLRHLGDATIGLVGPVTNFVGNEARVEVDYRTWGEMEAFAADRARRYEGQVADIAMLAMFCVAMRRETYETVGPLDERFGLGMFEDDDYAQRVRAAGGRIVCAGDVFVHHVGQAAFKHLILEGHYDALFARNRLAYEAKWGVRWKRHEHALLNLAPGRDVDSAPAPRWAAGTRA